MVSGGHGSTTSDSRSWSRLLRRVGESRASQPWTTWPRLPDGLCSEQMNRVLIPLTHGSNDATKPKTFQDVDRCERTRGTDRVLISIANIILQIRVTVFITILFEFQSFVLDNFVSVPSCPHSHITFNSLLVCHYSSIWILRFIGLSSEISQKLSESITLNSLFRHSPSHLLLSISFAFCMHIDFWYFTLFFIINVNSFDLWNHLVALGVYSVKSEPGSGFIIISSDMHSS